MKGIYLLLGSNLGDRLDIINSANALIIKTCGAILNCSSIYESAPWGEEDQPAFLNQVIEIESELDADTLLERLQQIELQLGRERFQKWGERKIDIDILYYGSKIITTKSLTIPHPEIQNRKFTLMPMDEISPELVHPQLNMSQKQLLSDSQDPLWVRKTDYSAISC